MKTSILFLSSLVFVSQRCQAMLVPIEPAMESRIATRTGAMGRGPFVRCCATSFLAFGAAVAPTSHSNAATEQDISESISQKAKLVDKAIAKEVKKASKGAKQIQTQVKKETKQVKKDLKKVEKKVIKEGKKIEKTVRREGKKFETGVKKEKKKLGKQLIK